MQTAARAMMRARRVGPVAAGLRLPAQHRSLWRQTARCLIAEQVNCSNQHLLDEVSHQQQEQMSRFIDILLEENKVVNLTAIRDREEAVRRHVLDSLALLPVMEGLGATGQGQDAEAAMQLRVVDVGSGAGLPGLILAMARPHWQVTLLDSLGKRCRFVEAAMKELGIANANVVWARAEEAGREANMREGFDVAVARAVVEMRVLAEYCLPLLTVGGYLVAAKGANSEEEVALADRAIQTVGGQLVGVQPVQSWTAAGQCQAVVVRKTRRTPKAYPRRPGVPKKSPL